MFDFPLRRIFVFLINLAVITVLIFWTIIFAEPLKISLHAFAFEVAEATGRIAVRVELVCIVGAIVQDYYRSVGVMAMSFR